MAGEAGGEVVVMKAIRGIFPPGSAWTGSGVRLSPRIRATASPIRRLGPSCAVGPMRALPLRPELPEDNSE
jgi:hypothetical protein